MDNSTDQLVESSRLSFLDPEEVTMRQKCMTSNTLIVKYEASYANWWNTCETQLDSGSLLQPALDSQASASFVAIQIPWLWQLVPLSSKELPGLLIQLVLVALPSTQVLLHHHLHIGPNTNNPLVPWVNTRPVWVIVPSESQRNDLTCPLHHLVP